MCLIFIIEQQDLFEFWEMNVNFELSFIFFLNTDITCIQREAEEAAASALETERMR